MSRSEGGLRVPFTTSMLPEIRRVQENPNRLAAAFVTVWYASGRRVYSGGLRSYRLGADSPTYWSSLTTLRGPPCIENDQSTGGAMARSFSSVPIALARS